MTFSLVARDPATGRLGVAVATAALAVGRGVPWARAGVGVVATQAHTNRSYGPRGLRALAAGQDPDRIVADLVGGDPERDDRQLAVLAADGRTAHWTGRGCVPACGAVTGDGYSAQGNMLRSRSVLPSLAAAYDAASGPLERRLLAALDAAEEAGGDLRGRQSAALLVVGPDRDDDARPVQTDLRVDDHPEPLGELRRLLDLQTAVEGGDWDALADAGPAGLRPLYAALALARAGDRTAARERLARLTDAHPGWRALLRRLRATGRLEPGVDPLDP